MTTLTKTDEISIIKTDEVGRRQTPAARRERLLDEFDRSRLGEARFAAVTGLKYSTFAAWVHRRRKQPNSASKVPAKSADPVRWLEAVVATAQTAGEPIVQRGEGENICVNPRNLRLKFNPIPQNCSKIKKSPKSQRETLARFRRAMARLRSALVMFRHTMAMLCPALAMFRPAMTMFPSAMTMFPSAMTMFPSAMMGSLGQKA
jgi:hypothetical protein